MNSDTFNSSLIEAASFTPLSLELPDPWCGHIPFAAWLVNAFRPATFVELGTHSGNSYFTVCQMVRSADINTRCYAVDSWQGDEHAGHYGDDVYRKVDRHNEKHYAPFSQLLRMTFDEALDHFSPESIDLLHIDGMHTYEAVRHDFESWLPKLTPNAVVLFHDTNVHERHFGVWQLWDELQRTYPNNMQFMHSNGLGVLQLNSANEQAKLEFLRPDFTEKDKLRRYFSALGAQHVKNLELRTIRQTVAEHDERVANLNRAIEKRDNQVTQLSSDINALQNSTSWKITEPIRFLSRAATRARTTLHILRRKPPRQLARRLILLLRSEGITGIYHHWKTVSDGHSAVSIAGGALVATTTAVTPRHQYTPVASVDIDQYDHFFIDVFDTAIIRLFKQPVDLFGYIGAKSGNPQFPVERVEQETVARKNNPKRRDISIREIYSTLPNANLAEEIGAERRFCVDNPEIFSFYQTLLAKDKHIYFVSDMYLDRETIAAILEESGYTTYDAIYVSSEDDIIKGDGSRFAWLKQTIPECGQRGFHLGDNHMSDFVQPRQHGFDALHTMEADDYYLREPFLQSKMPALLSAGQTPGLSFMLAMFRYWNSRFEDKSPDYWQQFGFLYGGALISTFCEFIHDELARQQPQCRRIFFLARDGDIMTQVFRILYDDIEPVYLFASRRCMVLPALQNMDSTADAEGLHQFAIPIGADSAEDIIERFAYSDLHGLEADLKKLQAKPGRWTEAEIYACIRRNKEEILPKVEAERRNLLGYLEQQQFFAEDNVTVADVGWGGSIQDALVRLLRHEGYQDKQIHGFYMGVNSDAAHLAHKHGFLTKGDSNPFQQYVNLIELLTSSPKDGIIRIGKRTDGQYYPVTMSSNENEARRQHAAQGIQSGVIEFAKILKERQIRLHEFIKPKDFQELFAALQNHPSPTDVENLEQLRHPLAIGNIHSHRVLGRASAGV